MRLRAGPGLSVLLTLALILLWAASDFAFTDESRAGGGNPAVMAIDGDTIQLGDRVIQLYGIDAPELGQHCKHDNVWLPCGLTAAHELNKQLQLSRQEVECQPAPAADPSGSVCFAGDVDVAQAMLTGGYVIATPTANPDYHELEEKAREARLGLWHSQFIDPAAWRQGERLPNEPGPADEACPVKAVVLADGRRVYFVPTDETYDSITVDPAKGDRRYCSDEAARKDGWRRVGESQP